VIVAMADLDRGSARRSRPRSCPRPRRMTQRRGRRPAHRAPL